MSLYASPRTVRLVSPGLIAAAAGLACVAASADAQMSWLGGAGNWSVAANWSPANVPDNTGETATIGAAGAYTVALNGSYQVGGIALSNPTALLAINTGQNLALGAGGLSNDSTLTVNATGGGSGTSIQLLSSQAWSGSGAVRLNASSNLETAIISWNGGGETITQSAGHSLVGTGRVYTFLTNNGVVDADVNGRVLWLTNFGKTNNNLFRASNGGTLSISTSVDQTGGGRIEADGGVVVFSSASVSGGQVNVLAGGEGRTAGTTGWTNVTSSGPFGVAVGTTLQLTSALTNNGTITVNESGGGSGTVVQLINSTALNGTGVLALNASTNIETAIISWNGGGEVLTQAATHTIRGTGRVYAALANNGLVTADVAGRVLLLSNTGKTNTNVMSAVGGGFLDIATTISQSGAGQIRAVDGTVRHASTINDGLLFAGGTGLHQVTGTTRWNRVTLSGPAAVEVGTSLQLADSMVNNGTITVNRTAGGAGTLVQALNSLGITGTGEIVLNAGSNIETAQLTYNGGGEVLTLGSGQTVRGTGRVYLSIVNNGLVNANVPSRTMLLSNTLKTNNATMKATGGGTLAVITTVNQAPGAQLLADGSNVNYGGGATINGGHVRSQGGGLSYVSGTTRFNGVTVTGPLQIEVGHTLQLDAGLINNGQVTVNPTTGGAGTILQVLTTQALTGPGEVVLNASSNLDTAILTYNGGGEVLTHGAAHTIRGTGKIHVSLVNEGLVHADRDGKILQLVSVAKTNNATMKATGGGILSVSGIGIGQAPGAQLLADGGLLSFSGCTITGGHINAVGGGSSQIVGGSRFNGVTITGPLAVVNGHTLQIDGGCVNNGTVTVNPSAGGSGTAMQALSSQLLSGSGEVILNASANLDTAYLTYAGGAEVLTQAAGHTVRGTGNIYVSVLNRGLIEADRAGKALQLLGVAKSNEATIKSSGGGILAVTNVGVTQTAGAQILADGGIARYSGATISGGSVNSTNGGVSEVTGGSRFNAVTISGPFETSNGTTMQVADGLVNNGAITVNSSAGGSGTLMQFLNSQTLSGTGAVYLNASSNFDTSYLTYNGGGEVLTNDVDHTIGGKGRLYVRTQNNGVLSPGSPGTRIGQLDLRGNAHITCGPTSEVRIDVGGSAPTAADRITGDKTIALDGDLRIAVVAPYIASRGDEWTIISGSNITGGFVQMFAPAAVNGVGFAIQYFNDRVVLRAVCYADVNNDGGIDGADVEAFFNLWEAGDPVADLNNDGGIDGADVETFFEYWEGGGC